MKTICIPRLTIDRKQGAETDYRVQLWHSYDGGKTFLYAGYGKNFDNPNAANAYINENRTPLRVFPVITEDRQQAYEQTAQQASDTDGTPLICGFYGRACRRMNDPEGANRALCNGCKLSEYCKAADMLEYARS